MLLIEWLPGSFEVLCVTTCIPTQVPSEQQIFTPLGIVRSKMNPSETAIDIIPENIIVVFIILVQKVFQQNSAGFQISDSWAKSSVDKVLYNWGSIVFRVSHRLQATSNIS